MCFENVFRPLIFLEEQDTRNGPESLKIKHYIEILEYKIILDQNNK